jgi:ERCC4-related helicase
MGNSRSNHANLHLLRFTLSLNPNPYIYSTSHNQMKELSLTPRDYQKNIFETAKNKNTLVVLPTGVGKTLIALMVAIDRLKKFPLQKILILAPTKPLVEQHFETFKKNLPDLFASLDLFTGAIPAKSRKKTWDSAEIIFSTPQCIANDLKNHLYNLNSVSLLVIDEAHRCLKNYDYNKIAHQYKFQAENQLILGLTASPGSEKTRVSEICKNLAVDEVEIRTRDSPDVKPYLQNLEFQKIEVPFPKEFIEIRVLLNTIYNSKVSQLRNRNLLFGPANKITLLKLQGKLASQVSSRNFQAMVGMSLTAQAIKISHALELLETQTLSGLHEYLLGLQKQAEQKKSKGVQTLVKTPEFNAAFLSLKQLISQKVEHPKVEELKVLIEQEFESSRSKSKPKIIIFSQFRETASTISRVLNQIPKVNAKLFVGQAKKTNSSSQITGLSQKEQRQIILDFKEGKINILCATSIGEEGLDLPEVNAVYFYEPIPSAIRKIQRAGRTARLNPGKLCILITKDTRDQAHHYASSAREKKMHRTIETVKQDLKNKNTQLDKFK